MRGTGGAPYTSMVFRGTIGPNVTARRTSASVSVHSNGNVIGIVPLRLSENYNLVEWRARMTMVLRASLEGLF